MGNAQTIAGSLVPTLSEVVFTLSRNSGVLT